MSFFINNNESISCLIPPNTIDNIFNLLALKNVYGYACNDGTDMISKVVVNVDSASGIPPYEFDLATQSGDTYKSTTGIFYDVGVPNDIVKVTISDACRSYSEDVTISNLQSGAKVAFSDDADICLGNPINLIGFSLVGALMGYDWTGPNGFFSSEKDPEIDPSTLDDEGFYVLSLSLKDEEKCMVKDSVYISIIDFVSLSEVYVVEDEICADDMYFMLRCDFYKEKMEYYHVKFQDEALQQGFQNIEQGIIYDENYFIIPIPTKETPDKYVMPDYYTASINVSKSKCKSEDLVFSFTISYPSSIIQQKWNDVIAVLNEKYNGGYNFSGFEWYKDDQRLVGEKGSYLYITPSFDFDANYRVMLTREFDENSFFTCPVKFKDRKSVKVYPQFASRNEPIHIETQLNGTAVVWGILGQKIAQYPVIEQQINTIYLKNSGFYVLEFISEKGDKLVFKVVVN